MFRKRKKDKGFTLIELLATIAILAIVSGFAIYVAVNLIDNSKDKGYLVTINNIEAKTSDYLKENSEKLFYELDVNNNDIEYQCVTVRELVNMGYFKNNITKSKVRDDRYVQLDDYIYIARDVNTKTIVKNEYLLEDDNGLCGKPINVDGNVLISVTPDGYSKYKDVTIKYRLKNYYDIDNYSYKFRYDRNGSSCNGNNCSVNVNYSIISDEGDVKKIRVYDNGKITGYIEGLNVSKSIDVKNIDITGPDIVIETNAVSYVSTINSKIIVTDGGSGGDKNTYKYIYSDNVDAEPKTKFTSGKSYSLADKTGVYYLIVEACDKLGNCSKKISDKLYIDNTLPKIILGTDGNSNYQKTVSSKITVKDDNSGGNVSTYKYIYSTNMNDSSKTVFSSGKSYSLSKKTGIYYLIVDACDKVGNCVKKVSNKFYLDNTKPVIKINDDIVKVYGVSFNLMNGVTITDNVDKDVSSSVYLGSKKITSYSNLLLGDNIVTYKAIDDAGNEVTLDRKITIVLPDKEFNYKESEQVYEVMADGTYIVEAYGAQGGNSGGLGGYVKAEVTLKTGDKLIVNTGGVNGYNGGGGYKVSGYNPGGGASTVRYNGSYIVIAGGGGAKGNQGSSGAGGSGNGSGGDSVGAGAGKSGSNGGGGSNSLNHSYRCNCYQTGGGCAGYETFNCNCGERLIRCYKSHCDYGWGCDTCYGSCNSWYPVETHCSTCTNKGKSGYGGSNKVVSPSIMVENKSGVRSGNGYVKISYKLN